VTAGSPAPWLRQRAVSSWGCLLYLAFCLSTARLLVATPAKQTARSEQRQDTDVLCYGLYCLLEAATAT
jgi:hypothetical protein